MRLMRVFLRLGGLSLAAGVVIILTWIYGGMRQSPSTDLQERTVRQNRPPWPDAVESLTILADGVELILYAVIGRTVLRLRLSPSSRSERELIRINTR
jgi:hypothetical protein